MTRFSLCSERGGRTGKTRCSPGKSEDDDLKASVNADAHAAFSMRFFGDGFHIVVGLFGS